MKNNIYDVSETIIIVGSCLERMQKDAYEILEKMTDDIFELCLEVNHINMAITKIIGNQIVQATARPQSSLMLATIKIISEKVKIDGETEQIVAIKLVNG